jgi:hypothetical protein
MTGRKKSWCVPLVLSFGAAALLTGESLHAKQAKGEDEIRAAFGLLRSAIKSKDPAKIWDLLDADTKADAERGAKKLVAVYKKADIKGKAEHETNFGLTPDEFAKLDGKLVLKTKRFLGKYDEIPGSKITSITVQGEGATLNYLEADGDKEKLNYTRQDGKWKVALPIPKLTN